MAGVGSFTMVGSQNINRALVGVNLVAILPWSKIWQKFFHVLCTGGIVVVIDLRR
jgi:hypothetical protein